MSNLGSDGLQKNEHIHLRVTRGEKELLKRAAVIRHEKNLSMFILRNALELSARAVRESENLMLSDQDRNLFLKALDAPREPSNRLKKAAQIYQSLNAKL